jgi:lipoate-protein ligase A
LTYYIESKSTDPHYNLALEQFVFDRLSKELSKEKGSSFFMLWQNHNAIIVGKHQNTLQEINAAFVKEHNISVVRRLSGGGAVYHDLGNINFTFITDADNTKGMDFSVFCKPIQEALCPLGVPVEISGRNDMHVEGKKFSGNAQYVKEGRVMHHGTILYDSNLEILSQALNVGKEKIESKAIKSVRSRVTNIRPYMKQDMSTEGFWEVIKHSMIASLGMNEVTLSAEHDALVNELKEKVYSQWSWNYGNSPPYTVRKERRIDGCGKIEILLDVEREGKIRNAAFFGDFFGNSDPGELGNVLVGHHLEYNELKTLFNAIDISRYFHGLDTGVFLAVLLD